MHPATRLLMAAILSADPKALLVLLEGRVGEWTHRLSKRMRRTIPEFGQRVRFLPAVAREDFLDLLEQHIQLLQRQKRGELQDAGVDRVLHRLVLSLDE